MPSSPARKLREMGRESHYLDWMMVWSGQLHTWKCTRCRKGLLRNRYQPVSISPSLGEVGSDVQGVECPKCGMIHRFNLMLLSTADPDSMTITIYNSTEVTPWCCPRCDRPLFQSQGRAIRLDEGLGGGTYFFNERSVECPKCQMVVRIGISG